MKAHALSLKSHLYSPVIKFSGLPSLSHTVKFLGQRDLLQLFIFLSNPVMTCHLRKKISVLNQNLKKKKRKSTYERIVLVSFHCQLDTIWSHLN